MCKPNYLILGGVGFTGRNIIEQLLKNNSTGQIIVVDKARPELSWLTGNHKECYGDEKVIYKQKNLLNPRNIEEILNTYPIDYVINCATESRNGMSSNVYDETVIKLGVICAEVVTKYPTIKRFVQLSTGEVYSSTKATKKEDGKIDPWTKSAKAFAILEQKLSTIPNLNYIILRCAFAYGIGDRYKITPRIIITAVYKLLNEEMKLLWTDSLVMNTVNIVDVARASIFLCDHGECGSIYNVADSSNTTQGTLTSLICDIFNVKHSFIGKFESRLAKLDINNVCEEINDKHSRPWFDACIAESIDATPLSPYINKELFGSNHLSMDGTKIQTLGFVYQYPTIKKELIKEIVDDFYKNNMFPKKCLP